MSNKKLYCRDCKDDLILGKNWRDWAQKTYQYQCTSCYNKYKKNYRRKHRKSKKGTSYLNSGRKYQFRLDFLDDYGFIAKIPVTQGLEAIVDLEDVLKLCKFNWFANKSKRKKMDDVYYVKRHGKSGDKKFIYMQYDILKKEPGLVIDHINGDPLDNRRCNLRLVTQRQNNQNRHDPMTSTYPGVSWSNIANKWTSQIDTGTGKKKNLGYFNNEKAAFKAYKKAVLDLTGEKTINIV